MLISININQITAILFIFSKISSFKFSFVNMAFIGDWFDSILLQSSLLICAGLIRIRHRSPHTPLLSIPKSLLLQSDVAEI